MCTSVKLMNLRPSKENGRGNRGALSEASYTGIRKSGMAPGYVASSLILLDSGIHDADDIGIFEKMPKRRVGERKHGLQTI